MFSRAGPPVSPDDVQKAGSLPKWIQVRWKWIHELLRSPRRMASASDTALVDRLAASIQARVLSGEFASGSRLRQESLASEFGVSRTPVREALRKLQAAGIVQLEPRRGARVRGPSAREVREAYEVRAELEGLAAALASGRMRDEELYRLRAA